MKHIKILFFALLLVGCKENEKSAAASDSAEKPSTNVVKVKTVQIQSAAESADIRVTGIVLSDAEAKPAFKTGGVIQKTYFKQGDKVKAGQLLATLVLSEIDAQIEQAEQGLAKADRDLQRAKNLFADSVATLEQVQNATTGYEVAKRTVEIGKFNRKFSEVRAPISGIIVKEIMHSGEIVGPGMPVCAIMGVGNKDWKINAGLIDRDWARVKTGDQVTISMDAFPGKSFGGVVSQKSQVGGSASGTFDIEVQFRNMPPNLAAGMVTNLSIRPTITEKRTLIPVEAVIKTNGNTAQVFTIENGKAKKLTLQIGQLLGDQIAIVSGLEGITEVITTGAMYVEEGDFVEL